MDNGMFMLPGLYPNRRNRFLWNAPVLILGEMLLFAGGLTMEPVQASNTANADVTAVRATGNPGAYQFAVAVSSPDKGCEQYANWWEVVTEDGKLVYRRVLLHSHVDEQPFTRSGGPVAISPDTVVWVRAHMHPGGYGGKVMKGTPKGGFKEAPLPTDFARGLEKQSPLPTECAF